MLSSLLRSQVLVAKAKATVSCLCVCVSNAALDTSLNCASVSPLYKGDNGHVDSSHWYL